MEPSLAEKLQSPLVTFRLGAAGDPVTIHSEVIGGLSIPLRTLVIDSYRYGVQMDIKIPDIEKEDFLRLCEFAYRGEYTSPTYEAVDSDDEDIEPSTIPSIMPTLIADAKVFWIAARYLVESLGKCAIGNVDRAYCQLLKRGTKDPETIVELIHIAYGTANDPDGVKVKGMERLRRYVVMAAARMSQAHAIDDSDEFKRILEGGGEFVVDFWRSTKDFSWWEVAQEDAARGYHDAETSSTATSRT